MGSIVQNHLPEDVLIEILSRLPVESLLNFAQVSKFWYSLIKNFNFIAKHLYHTNRKSPRLLVHYHVQDCEPGKSVLALFSNEITTEPPVHQDIGYLEMPKYSAEILGPANGLFFVYNSWNRNDTRAIVWNPATKEFRVVGLPVSDMFSRLNVFGFGLDLVRDDCKVVCMRFISYGAPEIWVYSLGSDSWRRIYPFLDSISAQTIRPSIYTTYLDGGYYWLSRRGGSGSSYVYVLLRFDMGSEVFREIEGPDMVANNPYWGDLVVHNESIALLLSEYSGGFLDTIDIWVMREEGSWTKHLTVGPLFRVKRPLGFWKNDELLFEMSGLKLVLYNPYDDEIRSIGINGNQQHVFCRVFSYKESLVSVKGRNTG